MGGKRHGLRKPLQLLDSQVRPSRGYGVALRGLRQDPRKELKLSDVVRLNVYTTNISAFFAAAEVYDRRRPRVNTTVRFVPVT